MTAIIIIVVFVVAAYLIISPQAGASNMASVDLHSLPNSSSIPRFLPGDYVVPTGMIAAVATNAGFSGDDLVTAVAIALAESSGHSAIVGDQTLAPRAGPSIGLWQINIGDKAHPDARDLDLTDPQVNANYAYQLYSGRGGYFDDWTTYGNGKYAKYIDQAQSGVNS